ncbi:hypothetical protein EMCRGX_G031442 [Ephydatia muelleri]
MPLNMPVSTRRANGVQLCAHKAIAKQVNAWKTSKGKPYDVILLRIHDKKPTGSGDVKEARLRQKEDSPSSSDDGSTARKKAKTDKPGHSFISFILGIPNRPVFGNQKTKMMLHLQ